MNKLLASLALVTVIVFAISCGISKSTEAERTKAYGFAQAQMTMASGQAQSQMTMASAESTKASAEASAIRTAASAEASAIRSAAITPIVMVVIAVILALVLIFIPVTLFVLHFLYSRQPFHQSSTSLPPTVRVIEQRTVVLIPSANMGRRELYQAIGGNADVRQIESGVIR